MADKKPKQEEKKLDETVPGGKYLLPDGTVVDANGQPIKEDKDKSSNVESEPGTEGQTTG